MTDNWAIEAHNKSGKRFFSRRVVSQWVVDTMVAELLTEERTGGIVIYRSTVAESNEPVKPVMLDCETDENENPENFEKVAQGNEGLTAASSLVTYVAGGSYVPLDEADDFVVPSALSAYERGEHPCPPLGGCKTCGCPPENMPMVNRGTGWCCENHRKEQLKNATDECPSCHTVDPRPHTEYCKHDEQL